RTAMPTRVAVPGRIVAETPRAERDDRLVPRLPPSMLERFGSADHPTGNTP
ncbi:MAG TPA: Flp pilus assembly protein TadD, partial [Stenotrophomonas sp.]|nr:Flp pilus assembly protein TadD [Stenotrophomonas sp.]